MDHPAFSHSFDVHHEKPDHHQSSTLNGSQVVLFSFEVWLSDAGVFTGKEGPSVTAAKTTHHRTIKSERVLTHPFTVKHSH